MKSYAEILYLAERLGDDAIIIPTGTDISIDLNDFEGFDEEWCEIMRPYDNAEAVDNFITMLEAEADSIDDDYYTVYHLDWFTVTLGYTSMDI